MTSPAPLDAGLEPPRAAGVWLAACREDVLGIVTGRLGGACDTVSEAIECGYLTREEWRACLALYARQGRAA